jgi:hypothetical protein
MGFPYRCSKCRGRNTLPRALEDYIRVPKCRHCAHGSFYVDKIRLARRDGHENCRCGGYHHTHRIKSKFCEHHPDYQFNVRTMRYKECPEEVRLDIAFNTEQQPPTKVTPF